MLLSLTKALDEWHLIAKELLLMSTKMGLRLRFSCCSFFGQNLSVYFGIQFKLSCFVTRNSGENLAVCTIAHVSLTSAGSLTTQIFLLAFVFLLMWHLFDN